MWSERSVVVSILRLDASYIEMQMPKVKCEAMGAPHLRLAFVDDWRYGDSFDLIIFDEDAHI